MNESIRDKIGKIVFIGSVLVILYALINSIGGDMVLKKKGECTKGILYRATIGPRKKPSFWYKFLIDGKKYDGRVVQDGVIKIGDSICIVYWPSLPRVNRPLSYFDNGVIKCGCN
jgi:hypothetical protein